MRNPYIMLGVNENATNEEIEIARKKQLKLQCSNDENKKAEDGEYLSDVINQAADSLLNPEKRKEIDKILNSNNKSVPVISTTSFQYPSQVILTSISDRLINPENKLIIKRSFFDKKIECKKFFVGVLSNTDCVYFVENVVNTSCSLYEYFTDRLVAKFCCGECPWDKAEVFDIDGLSAIAYPAYQILPHSIIRNGKVSDSNLRAIYPIIREVVKNNIDEVNKLFSDEQVKVIKK